MTEEAKKKRQEIAINGAISYWENKKTPYFYWWDKKEYTVEYCNKQIEYFKGLKL